MIELSRYGRVLREYKASGSLQFGANQTFYCSFDAVQFTDGAIRVQCYFPRSNGSESARLRQAIMRGVSVQGIYGITQDNQEIQLSGQILGTNVNARTIGDSTTTTCSFVATEMLVKSRGDRHPVRTLRFGITNYEFEGNVGRERKTETSQTFDRGIFAIYLPFGQMRIERLLNYDEVVANLVATQGIEPTCEILMEPSGHDVQWAKDAADTLCTLLSLAKGTKIVWIYLDGYDTEGVKCLIHHKYAVTRPYSGRSASVICAIYPDDTRQLIEKGYERLQKLNIEYKLSNVIDVYLESKRPHSFLESKGLAAIQAMELLAAKYAREHNLAFVMDETEFGDKLREIGMRIKGILREAFDESQAIALCGKNNEKLRVLNRRALGQVLKQMFQDFDLQVSGTKLHALIETRNALVHTGSFKTKDRVKEYYRIISIMDRLLLNMLGYKGYILDCENKWSRVKL
jgi:hypothetical protein